MSLQFKKAICLTFSTLFIFGQLPLHSDSDDEIHEQNEKKEMILPTLKSMDSDDQKASGLNKLSDGEKAKLQEWINKECQKYAEKNANEKSMADISKGTILQISDIQNYGKKIGLSDGKTYAIQAHGAKKSSKWQVAETVELEPTKKDDVFKLKNVTRDEAVRGKIVKS